MVSKKNKRKIVVDGSVYWWQVHYDKDGQRPYIFIASDAGKLLVKQAYDREMIVSPVWVETIIRGLQNSG